MNETEINSILKTRSEYIQTFASDELKMLHTPLTPGLCLIANTAPRTNVGEHWIALYVGRNIILVFDSLGQEWRDNSNIKKYIEQYFQRGYDVIYNRRRLQSLVSNACGIYCIKFLEHLTKKLYVNDLICLNLYKSFLTGRLAGHNFKTNGIEACSSIDSYKKINKFMCIP